VQTAAPDAPLRYRACGLHFAPGPEVY